MAMKETRRILTMIKSNKILRIIAIILFILSVLFAEVTYLKAKKDFYRADKFMYPIAVHSEELPSYCIGKYRELVCNPNYNWDYKTMIAIMIAESDESPVAWNENEPDGSESYGLFQINSVHGINPMLLDIPSLNVEYAYRIWQEQGCLAWGSYTDGRYLPIYLKL